MIYVCMASLLCTIFILPLVSYNGTADGLQLNFADGTGYYLEIPEIPQESDSLTEVFYIGSVSDHEKLLDALEEGVKFSVSMGKILL